MDIFGSNATPMGGGAGRCDAIIGAVEAQKAQGILHLHFFMYIQTLLQFLTLQEIADKLRNGIITSESWKEYVSYVRCAAYPDAEKAERDRNNVEQSWPAYTTVDTLARLSETLWEDTAGSTSPHFLHQDFERAAWEIDAANWLRTYDGRLQEALLYMNHHIHPLVNEETGERRVLPSCQPKDKSNTCKGGFPLETQLTETPLLVCKCIADARGLVQRGPRSLLGTVLPKRNSAWLNAGPRSWLVFNADNGDIKFPHRLPILEETHERTPLFDVTRNSCCSHHDLPEMLYDLQAGLAMAAGYFGGYTSKMQDIGHRELGRMRESLARKVTAEPKTIQHEAFKSYSKRLVKDLEAKGIIRTAVEGVNLALFANHEDVLMAECIRTFPTVTFPASLLLKREEIETQKVTGTSVIAAVHDSKEQRSRAYVQAPFDLLYGFRGNEDNVDVLSPYEMLMHWSMEKIFPPSKTLHVDAQRSKLTSEGAKYKEQCESLAFVVALVTYNEITSGR